MVEDTHYTEVDGVRTLWCDTPGALTATLSFRVGQSDETLVSRGITHLCEHLALSGVGTVPYQYNGSTGLTSTAFVVRGTPGEVALHLRMICEQLSTGQFLERLEHERRVLSIEGAQRAPGIVGEHLLSRFGASGPGLTAYEELGLHRLSAEDLWAWAATWFTRQNAVLSFSAPPPPGLVLPLSEGSAVISAPAAPLPITTPLFTRAEAPAGISTLLARSRAAVAASTIYSQRVIDSLRHEAGTSYSPGADYIALDGANALAVTVADGDGHSAARSAWSMWTMLGTFAAEGPSAEEVDWYRSMIERAADEPYAPLMTMTAQVDDLLHLGGCRTAADIRDDLAALDVAAVHDEARSMWNTALVNLPPRAEPPEWDLAEFVVGRGEVDLGTVHRYERRPYTAVDNWSAAEALVASSTALSLDAGARTATVALDESTTLLAYGDGARSVIDRSGAQIAVRPTAWVNGLALVPWLDAAVGAERTVAIGARQAAPTGSELSALRTIRGMDPRSRAGKRPRRSDQLIDAFDIGPMRVDLWAVDSALPPEVPDTRRWLPAAMTLGWLAHRQLTAPWLEASIPDTLAAFRRGELALFDLFAAAGGALYTDMADPSAAPFLADLSAPLGEGPPPIVALIDAATGQPGQWWHLTEQHAGNVWTELDRAWSSLIPTWPDTLGQQLSPRVPPLTAAPSLCQPTR